MLAKCDIPQIPGLPRIVFRIAIFGITGHRDQECERESEMCADSVFARNISLEVHDDVRC